MKGNALWDAIIAASAIGIGDRLDNGLRKVSLKEMIRAFDCVLDNSEKKEYLADTIPEIVDIAMAVANTQKGRIIEVADQTSSLAENYRTRIRGVSFPCTVNTDLNSGKDSPVAYA